MQNERFSDENPLATSIWSALAKKYVVAANERQSWSLITSYFERGGPMETYEWNVLALTQRDCLVLRCDMLTAAESLDLFCRAHGTLSLREQSVTIRELYVVGAQFLTWGQGCWDGENSVSEGTKRVIRMRPLAIQTSHI